MMRSRINVLIAFIGVVSFSSTAWGQFILPEKSRTTQQDIDVIRVDSGSESVNRLSAQLVNPKTSEILLKWRNVKKVSTLAVLRYHQAISNIDTLGKAKVIALLDGSKTVYQDQPFRAGKYYYAVVSKLKMDDDTAVLVAGENFTTKPVEVQKAEERARIPLKTVQSIHVKILDQNTIRISWDYEIDPGVRFVIYRYSSLMDTVGALKDATRVAVVEGEKRFYNDTNPPREVPLHYAIFAMDADDYEKRYFAADESYSVSSVVMPPAEIPVVRNLTGERVHSTQIRLTWENDSTRDDFEYIIYRSNDPIQNIEALSSAVILAYVRYNVTSYIDDKVSSIPYYYAVVTQDRRGEISKKLISGDNTLAEAVMPKVAEEPEKEEPEDKLPEVSPEKEESKPLLISLEAKISENRVLLNWAGKLEAGREGTLVLFRFRKKPRGIDDLMLGTLVKRVRYEELTFEDKPPRSGLYYYGLLVETGRGLYPQEFIDGDNLIGPVVYQGGARGARDEGDARQVYGEEPQLESNGEDQLRLPGYLDGDKERARTTRELDQVLKETYLRQNYKESLSRLAPYRKSRAKNIRAKAMFYSALSHYYLGDYKSALREFMSPEVKEQYKERADFWVNRTLENMNQ